MAPPDTIWHKESLKLKEIFGTREGFEICPYRLFPGPIKAPGGISQNRGGGLGGVAYKDRARPPPRACPNPCMGAHLRGQPATAHGTDQDNR